MRAIRLDPRTRLTFRQRAPAWIDRLVRAATARRPGHAAYARRLDDVIRQRLAIYPLKASVGQFSLVTCLYKGSLATPFEQTAESVFGQTSSNFEWVILAQGSIDSQVGRVLNRVAADPRTKVLSLPTNLGIIGGLRHCLERATGKYIVPLDGDDLLTPDALSVVASELHRAPRPLIYSDEDIWFDRGLASPFLRPDWDPVLNLSCSYIFHLMAFDRRIAMETGVFLDPAANWCQDWDTVCRFARAGHTPVHLAEVLYHWRAHDGSSTNTAEPNPASLESQRHVLSESLRDIGQEHLFEIRPFPLFRGAPEWWLARRRIQPASFDLACTSQVTPAMQSDEIASQYPFSRCVSAHDVPSLAKAVRESRSELFTVVQEGVLPEGDLWPWEAQGLFSLHPDLDLLGGRIVNPHNIVLGGPERLDAEANCSCPYRGLLAVEPGELALALKPHTIESPNSAFFVARTAFLQHAIAQIPQQATIQFLGPWLALLARSNRRRVAFSPLLSANARSGFDCLMQPSPEERSAYQTCERRWNSGIRSAAG